MRVCGFAPTFPAGIALLRGGAQGTAILRYFMIIFQRLSVLVHPLLTRFNVPLCLITRNVTGRGTTITKNEVPG
jgi:hypothetical protein